MTNKYARLLPWLKYITAQLRFAPVFLLALSVFFSACQGYTPIPATQTQTSLPGTPAASTATSRPVQLPSAILPTRTATATLPPQPTLGLKASDLQGMKISFWYARTGLAGDKDLLQSQVDEFNRTNTWGLKVSLNVFQDTGDLFNQIQASLYSTLPDLVLGYNFQLARLDSGGRFLADINPYIYDPKWGFNSRELSDFYPAFWSQDMTSGGDKPVKRLGFPFSRTGQVLFYNTTWAKELGFKEAPVTPEDFKKQACSAAAQRKDQKDGGWAVSTDPGALSSWLLAFGSNMKAPEGQGYAFNTHESQLAFTFLRDLFDQGCAWVPGDTYSNTDFAGRRALFISSSLTGLDFQKAAFQASSASDQWTVISYPSPGGEPAIDTYGQSFAILKSDPERQLAAWLLLKWLASPQNQAAWVQAYGTFPTRLSVLDSLAAYQKDHPQWQAAVALLPEAAGEPAYASWSAVRQALGDAGQELFSSDFKIDQVPNLLDTLQKTAADLDVQLR